MFSTNKIFKSIERKTISIFILINILHLTLKFLKYRKKIFNAILFQINLIDK